MIEVERLDPKLLAKKIHSARQIQNERWEKLAPFRDAGWQTYKTDVFREFARNRLSADYRHGRFELFFFGVPTQVYFDTAEEALKYVEEVERELVV